MQGCQNRDFASDRKGRVKSKIVKSQPLNYFCGIDIRNCKIAIKIDEFYQNKNNVKYML